MNNDVTYCANEECPKKYKCELYKEEAQGQEFWFTKYNSEECK